MSDRLAMVGAVLAAFLARLATLPGLTQGGLRLVSMDDYGHLRRALATVRDFPWVPAFDPFLNPPEGAVWIWPPLFDFLIALPARFLFGANADRAEVTLIASMVPPLVAAASVVPLFYATRCALGASEARLAVTLYALLPAAIRWSSFGHADQHAVEAAAFILVLAAFTKLLSAPATLDDGGGQRRWPTAVLPAMLAASAALALAMLSWQGAVFLAPVIGLAAWLAGRARLAGAALIAAAVLIAPWAVDRAGPTTYISFGKFQPVFLGLAGGLLMLTGIRRFGPWLAVAGGVTVATTWPPIANGVRHLFAATEGEPKIGGYLAYPADWLRLIAEYQPLWRGDAATVLSQLSPALLIVPVALVCWSRRALADRRAQAPLILWTVATATVLVMALMQKRYVYYLAVVVAAAGAWALPIAARRWRPAAALLAAAILIPTWPALRVLPASGSAVGEDILTTLETLAELDPPVREPWAPSRAEAPPVASVLAPWSLGHVVTLFAQRPAIADNFGYGFHRQARILTAAPEDDRQVADELRAWNCRYLITTELRAVLGAYAAAVGREGAPLAEMLAVRVHSSNNRRPLPFLELTLTSRTGLLVDGELVPRLKIFRVLSAAEERDQPP